MNQKYLAHALGIEASSLSKTERGQHIIGVHFLLEVADVLNIPYQSLIAGDFYRPGSPDRPEHI